MADRICVVVLGDVGRSPRMQYHSMSLANNGQFVDLIGYSGSKPHRLLVDNERITIRYIPEPLAAFGSLSVFGLALKCLWQAITLFWCLLVSIAKPDVILLQNPPGLPALLICWIVSRLRGSRFVIDWHNYTWSILALKYDKGHPLVRFVRWYEFTVGKWADHGFCVTEAMKKDLYQHHGCFADVFYDRPLKNVFRTIDLDERHGIMQRMAEKHPDIFGHGLEKDKTRFTERSIDGIHFRDRRPALLISSTSWTADEDFGMLFDALTLYDQKLTGHNSQLPDLVCVVTGKGPLKDYYLSRLPEWRRVQLCTPWLAAEDYPSLLASADLGVCLHASSSGLDLPMKAVDMLGCRIPVLALRYECIEELVKPDVNGRLFDDAQSLANGLIELLSGFHADGGKTCKLDRLRKTLNDDRGSNDVWNWETSWREVVKDKLVPSSR